MAINFKKEHFFLERLFPKGEERYHAGFEHIEKLVTPLIRSISGKIITIAGTNGKGETLYFLREFLKNRKTLSWVSPHILSIRERILIGENEISYSELDYAMTQAEQLLGNLKVSFYEKLFISFCFVALKNHWDYILLEVGLGGRLDCVNTFDASLVLLPSISRDHCEYLGNSYKEILREKLGVTRKNSYLISCVGNYLENKISNYSQCPFENLHLDSRFNYSQRNFALAKRAYELLEGKSSVEYWRPQFKGRGEILNFNNRYEFLGAHNIDGMRNLKKRNFSADFLLISFSTRRLEDLRIMLCYLNSVIAKDIPTYVTSFSHMRALEWNDLVNLGTFSRLKYLENWKDLLRETQGQNILISGSYFFMGAVQQFLHENYGPRALTV